MGQGAQGQRQGVRAEAGPDGWSQSLMSAARTTTVWADTVVAGTCRDARCRARLTFAENVRTGRMMPLTGELVALQTERDGPSGRQIWIVDLATSHFADCPGAA